jgi:uncharacterized membrane protein YvbJ
MYCPNCGAQNVGGAKYCRSCGEDLSVVSQVMKRHLPVFLIAKLDAYIDRKNERMLRDSVLWFLMGLLFLASPTQSRVTIWSVVGACLMFLTSIWEFLAYWRSRSREQKSPEGFSKATTEKLAPPSHAQLAPPVSVTETTTEHLDQAAIRLEKEL